MFLHFIFRAASVAVLTVSAVMAQSVSDSTPTQSRDTPAVPDVQYKSAFADYVPYTEQDIVPWRQANDLVGQIGGWRTYAKEARQPDNAATQPFSSTMPSPQINASSPSSAAQSDIKGDK